MRSPATTRRSSFSLAAVAAAALLGCGLPAVRHPGSESSAPSAPPLRTPRIGFLGPGDENVSNVGPFTRYMRELGYVPGESVIIETRLTGSDPTRAEGLAAELVRLPVDVLVADGIRHEAQAAKRATSTIPIVTVQVSDPVQEGLVTSLARPGGNVTGMANMPETLFAKRLELLHLVAPHLRRVAVAWNPGDAAGSHPNGTALARVSRAAQPRSLEVRPLAARSGDELMALLDASPDDSEEGLLVAGSPAWNGNAWGQRISDWALATRRPAAIQALSAGALVSVAVPFAEFALGAARFVELILKGAKPADLPMQEPTKWDIGINLKTAAALGLTVPQSVLLQATQVIESDGAPGGSCGCTP